MADDRLKQFALKLRDEVQTLAARLSQVEKIRAVARDGRDGAPGTPGESGAKGDRGEAGERGAQGLPGRDGRDGLPGPKGDSVTRAEVEPGNMLAIWIGDVKTLAGRIVAQRGEKGDKGDQGLPGPKGDKGDPGKDGKNGTQITKVELNGRELFIWLDGVKKKVGQIAFPSLGGAGGGTRRLPPDNCRIGFIDYNDAGTAVTPIVVTGGAPAVKLTNDAAGPFTNKDYRPEGVTDIWDVDTQEFTGRDLKLGDMVDLRLDLEVTTASPNTRVVVDMLVGVGSGSEYTVPFIHTTLKNAGTEQLNRYNGFYMGNELTLNNPAHFVISADGDCTVVVKGWYCKLLIRG